jgi:EAL domain-containing protein (putative c-di-GMP-specific phosphodiesterase class I)
VDMGRSLNLEITAEGVENEAQARFLETLGCHYGQGYYFSKPLPGREFAALVAEKRGTLPPIWRTRAA